MAARRFVEVTDKEIAEINSVAKKTRKTCVKILKQLFAEGEVFIGEYSPRRRLGEYSPIITSPSANNCYKIYENDLTLPPPSPNVNEY